MNVVDYIKKYNCSNCTDITNDIIGDIEKLFTDGIINDSLVNDVYYRYIGIYYEFFYKSEETHYTIKNHKYRLAKIYYLMSILYCNVDSMCNLAEYYYVVENNSEYMKLYFMMAIKEKCVLAMYKLGKYYELVENNYDEMKIYYDMAIKENDTYTMMVYAAYYIDIEVNHDLAKHYYNMAINNGDITGYVMLGLFYEQIEQNIDEMKKNYILAIEHNHVLKNKLIIDLLNICGVTHHLKDVLLNNEFTNDLEIYHTLLEKNDYFSHIFSAKKNIFNYKNNDYDYSLINDVDEIIV